MKENRIRFTPPPTPPEGDEKAMVQYARRLNVLLPNYMDYLQKLIGEYSPTPEDMHVSVQAPQDVDTPSSQDQPVKTLQSKIDDTESAGVIEAPTLSDATGDDLGWTEFTCLIRPSDDVTDELIHRVIAAGTIEITQDTTRYVGVEYNSGAPQVVSRTSDDFNKGTDEFRLAVVYNEGGTLHIKSALQRSGNFQYWVTHRLQEVEGLKRAQFYGAGGLVLADSADDNQNVKMSTGELYEGLQEYDISEFNSSGAATFDIYYRDGGTSFTKVAAQSTWPNTQYDDGDGGLATMTNNWYANLWFYVETDGGVVMQYGRSQYSTLAGAREETPPNTEPSRLVMHGTLLGRFLIQKSDTTATEVQSFFPETFAGTAVTHHHSLAGLGDDDHGQYFKLLGRSSGQAAYGGTAASENLWLGSTAHGTKGKVYLGGITVSNIYYDETSHVLDMEGADITDVDDITGNGGSIISGGTGSGDDLYLQSTTHGTKGDITLDSQYPLLGKDARARVYNDAAINVNNTTWTAMTFNLERFDYSAMHSPQSNTSRFTIATAGTYLVGGSIEFASVVSDQTRRLLSLSVNGAPGVGTEIDRHEHHQSNAGAIAAALSISTLWEFSATDYVELWGWQNSGGALNVTAEFWIMRIA